MPNWVTNIVKAPLNVLTSIIGEEGRIDFNKVVEFKGDFPWEGISYRAEVLAERVTEKSVSDVHALRALELQNRRAADLTKLNDDEFEQFIQMLRNFRKTGYLHQMDFARQEWGTKWNACEPQTNLSLSITRFETAWCCPVAVLEALSNKFPDELIGVIFADEDTGNNCGFIAYKNGEEVACKIAPNWSEQTEAEKKDWEKFAKAVQRFDFTTTETIQRDMLKLLKMTSGGQKLISADFTADDSKKLQAQ